MTGGCPTYNDEDVLAWVSSDDGTTWDPVTHEAISGGASPRLMSCAGSPPRRAAGLALRHSWPPVHQGPPLSAARCRTAERRRRWAGWSLAQPSAISPPT